MNKCCTVLAIMICITACNSRERIKKDVLYVTAGVLGRCGGLTVNCFEQ